MITINIGQQFSRFPSGRYEKNGSTSGEAFRKRLLEPALRQKSESVRIVMDDTIGYGSSFLEEAFGGLVRVSGFDANDLLSRLSVDTVDESLKLEVKEYIQSALSVNQHR